MSTTINSTALIDGFRDMTQAIKIAILSNLPIFIFGTPGIGKSAAPKHVAQELGIDLELIDCVTRESTDFAGLPRGTADGFAEFVPYGFARRMIDAVKPLIVVLDDLAQSPVDVQKAIMRLIHDRRIGEHSISDHVYFIGTGNSREDRAASTGLIEPLKSRFASLIQFKPTLQDWITGYALPENVDPLIIAFLKFRPAMFSAFEPRPDYQQSPSPRTWAHAAKIRAAGFDSRIEFSMLQGSIGPVAAAEFRNMIDLLTKLPDPLSVLNSAETDPAIKSAVLSLGNGSQFTFATALAGKCETESHFTNGARFLSTVAPECRELFVMLAVKRDPFFAETATYSKIVTNTLK